MGIYKLLLRVFPFLITTFVCSFSYAQIDQRLVGEGGAAIVISSTIKDIAGTGYIAIGSRRNSSSSVRDGSLLVKLDNNFNVEWSKTLTTTEGDLFYKIVKDNNAYYLLGTLETHTPGESDISVMKIDASGNEIWQKQFGVTETNNPKEILINSDGTLWIFAENYDTRPPAPFPTRRYIYFLILDRSTGNTISKKRFFDFSGGLSPITYCGISPSSAVIGHNQNVMMAGSSDSVATGPFNIVFSRYLYMLKWNSDGTFQSGTQLLAPHGFGPNYDIFKWLDGYAVVSNYDGGIAIIKTDSTVTNRFVDWGKKISLPCKLLNASSTILADGNLLVAAYGIYNVASPSGPRTHLFLLKIDQSGNTIWSKRIPVTGNIASIMRPIETASGKILIPATTRIGFTESKLILAMTDQAGRMNNCFASDVDIPLDDIHFVVNDYPFILFSGTFAVTDPVLVSAGIPVTTADSCFQQQPPVADFTIPTELCVGNCINLIDKSYNEPITHEWLFDNPSPDISTIDTTCLPDMLHVCFPVSGIYRIRLVVTNPFGTDTAEKFINVQEPLTPFSIGSDTSLCIGDSVILRVPHFPAGVTWRWVTPTGIFPNVDSVIARTSGLYRLIAKNICGNDTAERNITIDNPPSFVSAGPDTTVCVGSTIIINAVTDGTSINYLWSTNSIESFILPDTSGTYWVAVNNRCGTARDSVVVVFAQPEFGSVNLGNDTSICNGTSLLLQAPVRLQPYWTYLWQDASTNDNFLVTTPGTYSVVVSDGTCSRSDNITISFSYPPVIHLPADSALCEYDSLRIDISSQVTSIDTVLWNDGSNVTIRYLKNPQLYWCEIRNKCGSSRDTIIISQIKTPVYSLGNDISVCDVNSVQLQVNPILTGVTYLWSNGDNTPQTIVTASGQYIVTVSNRCAAIKDTINVTMKNTPKVDLPVIDTFLCSNETITLNAFDPQNHSSTVYNWNTGVQAQSIPVDHAGLYIVTAQNSCGSAKDSTTVTYSLLPAQLFTSDVFLCAGQTIQLQSLITDPSYTYLWNTGQSGSGISINKTGIYYLTVTDDRCSSYDSIKAYTCDAEKCIFLPNVFTPNNDSWNDIFRPVTAYCKITRYELTVFDRFGNKVFFSNDISTGWDGRLKSGKKLQGTYVYTLNYTAELPGGERKRLTLSGTVISLP